MARPNSDEDGPDLRMLAQAATHQGMINYLQNANTDLQAQNSALQQRIAASDSEKTDLKSQLEAARSELRKVKGIVTRPSFPRQPTDRSVDDQFEGWHAHGGIPLPTSAVYDGETSTNPLGTATGNSQALIKREEGAKALLSVSLGPTGTNVKETRSTSRKVTSTGRRAPKRKDTDRFTDNPPPAYGRQRPKRIRTAIDYAEQPEESVSAVARDIWSKSQTPDDEFNEEEDDLFVPDTASEVHDEEEEKGLAAGDVDAGFSANRRPTYGPAPDTTAQAANGPKDRYKDRPTSHTPRWAVGTKNQVPFRFYNKGQTVLGMYEAWYDGEAHPGGNPPIAQLESQYGASWRNHRDKKNHAYANNWISKRLKVIKGLEHLAGEQNKEPRALAREWDGVIQGRLTELDKCFPAPTNFDQNRSKIIDPLVYFASRPKRAAGAQQSAT